MTGENLISLIFRELCAEMGPECAAGCAALNPLTQVLALIRAIERCQAVAQT